MAPWTTSLNYSVGYPLLSNLFQKVLLFFNFPPGLQSLTISLDWGSGAASFERFVCLASGLNYLPCWALISVSKWRQNNLYNSSVNWRLNCGAEQSSVPSLSANLSLSSVAERMWWDATARLGKELPAKWEHSYWTRFINSEQCSYNYAMLELPRRVAGSWPFCQDVNLIGSVDVCLFC